MLAGDATDSLEQLYALRADAGRTRAQSAQRHDADDPRPLRRAPDDLPALARPRLSSRLADATTSERPVTVT
jgi:hypothetical protein